MLKRSLIIFVLFISNHFLYSQKDSISFLNESSKELEKLGYLILNGSTDSIRDSSCIAFNIIFEKALNTDNSMHYSFDSVKNISIQVARIILSD